MNTLFVVIVAEVLFCVFFTNYAKVFHGALLLFVAKILFPVVKSLLIHICWRIPEAIIHKHLWVSVKAHSWVSMFWHDPYKIKHGTLPVKEPGKRVKPTPERIPAHIANAPMPWIDEIDGTVVNPDGKPVDMDKELSKLMRKGR
jgi:hypothetical protein